MSDDYRWPGPGRQDVHGVTWWACDPYPTWFRWEGDVLHHHDGETPWADE